VVDLANMWREGLGGGLLGYPPVSKAVPGLDSSLSLMYHYKRQYID